MSTAIEWTDETWNPVVGCTKVSQGCKHCYAKTLHDKRHKAAIAGKAIHPQYLQPFETVQLMPERLEAPLHWRKARRVFVNSVSDVFHEDVPDEFISQMWAIMEVCRQHTFQILTKRPHRMCELVPTFRPAPLPNVWLGVSVENQEAADERIPLLLQTPAAVRFLSCEPLLGPVDLSLWLEEEGYIDDQYVPPLHWVIAGAESGPGARECRLSWIEEIVADCDLNGVGCFVKQLGRNPIDDIDHRVAPLRLALRSRKGGDPNEWPERLRVRPVPSATGASVTAVGPSRPVMRYHGGKWRSGPRIIGFFPPHRVYVEPFGGGASVLMRKPRAYAEVYNDLAAEVVNVFRVLRDGNMARELRRALYLTPFSREDFTAAYRRSDDPIESARCAIVRAFMGFGSASFNANHGTGFRANSKRSGTTPALDWRNYPEQIPAFVERLRGVVIENRDALELMPTHDSAGTLFYIDPPYPACVRAEGAVHGVRQRYVHEMTDDDHRALAQVNHALAGMIVLSGRGCELYDVELYPDWERHEFDHLDDGARTRREVVWLNPACVAARSQHVLEIG